MFKMTQIIYDALQEAGLKVFVDELERSSAVWAQFGIENGGSYKIRFISTDDDNDVAVRVFGILKADETNRHKLLPVLNALNAKYRYVKFIMDGDGDVNLEYDYLLNCPDPSASAPEIIARFVKIIDEAYPDLMRAMWA